MSAPKPKQAETPPPQPPIIQTVHITGSAGQAIELPIAAIDPNPFQPRHDFAESSLQELMQSIASNGIIQPVVVRRKADSRYELVTGERRLRAATALKLKTIPAVVKDVPDDKLLELAIIENIQREDLNPIEKGEAFHDFIQTYKLTHEEAASRLGVDRPTVSNHLRLLDLDKDVQVLVRAGALSMGHARALAPVLDHNLQLAIAKRAIKGALSVRHVEREVAKLITGVAPKALPQPLLRSPQVAAIEDELRGHLGTRVTVAEGRRKGSGKIVIEYYNFEDFDRIMSVIRR